MSTPTGPLGLYLPPLTPQPLAGQFADIKALEAWIRALPIANVGESARAVYTALHASNRSALPPDQRLKSVELLRPVILFLTSALEKHYLEQAFPLQERSYQTAELVRELDAEMAAGYKRVVEDFLSGADDKIDPKLLLTAVQRATHYLSHILLTSHQIYSAPFDYIWKELHHLYLFAEQNHLQAVPVADTISGESDHRSVEDDYKGALLFALANPNRLAQRNMSQVFALASHWASQCELLHATNTQALPGLFVVDLAQDSGPKAYRAEDHHSEHLRVINTGRLLQTVKDQGMHVRELPQWQRTATYKPVSQVQELMQRLITLWGSAPQREFSRTGNNHHAQFVLGLPALYEQLKPTASTMAYSDSAVTFSHPAEFRLQTPSDATPPETDIWSLAEHVDFKDAPPAAPLKTEPSDPPCPPPYACYVTNESAGGCRLIWKNGEDTRVGVGGLIGIRHIDFGGEVTWKIGVIRWLKVITRHDLVMGIEFIAQHARAAVIRRTHAGLRGVEYARALLLPQAPGMSIAHSIITPPLYKEGD
ncbi:MAG: hypothetical protein OEW08_00525, partial [Gammaproteobacteria bacterium]|nr:hypothetical protein [Gammaproteobacteria bacterium]